MSNLSEDDNNDEIELLDLESRVLSLISEVADSRIILPILLADADAFCSCINEHVKKLGEVGNGLIDEISRLQVVNIVCRDEEVSVEGHLNSAKSFLETIRQWSETMDAEMVLLPFD